MTVAERILCYCIMHFVLAFGYAWESVIVQQGDDIDGPTLGCFKK